MYNLIQFYGIWIKNIVVCITCNPKIKIFILYSIQDVLINWDINKVNRKYIAQFAGVNKPLVSKLSLSKSLLSLAYLFISAHLYIEKFPYLTLKGHIATT